MHPPARGGGAALTAARALAPSLDLGQFAVELKTESGVAEAKRTKTELCAVVAVPRGGDSMAVWRRIATRGGYVAHGKAACGGAQRLSGSVQGGSPLSGRRRVG